MKNAFPDFRQANVVVIGDLMLDRFYFGKTKRISPEAPVPVVNIERLEDIPGGAANVAMNIASLGAKCSLSGITGQDEAAKVLQQRLSCVSIECAFHQTTQHPTIIKSRIISAHQQLLRMDFESRFTVESGVGMEQQVTPLLSKDGVMILSDYDKGTLHDPQQWINLAKTNAMTVLVDPKGNDFSKYRGADLITPNLTEFEAVAGEIQSEADLIEKAKKLIADYDIKAVLITRSEQGMSLITNDNTEFHLPAIAKEVADVTGAGDTVIATLAAALAAGQSLQQAVTLANVAASIVVSKLGTSTVSEPELFAEYQRHQGKHQSDHSFAGAVTVEQLKIAVDQAKKRGEKIVFTNGCFDILHAGHVSYLHQARTQGDRLIVAINSDESVTKLKGKGRPINTADRRQIVLAGLADVDWVTVFEGDTPEDLLREIQPDILVKGGDYDKKGVVGWEIVEGYGGEVRVMGLTENCSTTAIVNKIHQDR
ncbi:bifunctional D-glycero-beta-D-manno-heptose-7-phosphate kinase/D-glycero-beta-D-manno-heptose 1-phosphate adenylyltransferase HldE [Methylophaga pinxianii]|uniref:bifunctional D-glycero-beta-D-manno-heptose-7-phosphate kinase/D-glycero-beta-D-manno-heptose 1-phosphate adenylyltransferase HldE n=1 Tax=Methylophaga pinxianii TaxID=2881052 RepID=UPI001CF41839|nr:bifunctional D-glycero-beta-D-manno-heptose-7-phosphate kinase/D-glycero-beta-D-manno-heptose 1-phosphate adenylyltransferase HldE [Methylophaga pinxianii]MCB2426904.1 bifunctional D-glycero-beta-D-manno-heptose-7-phosphate kinase/D-glycero-beta-D-manno-heptose 1-phosphate adenylyltransferase HldE [Methylophaga pinxianii]UPH45668.1 bifunctional D-glycero-beta-D-manno-heptose-7-phosphate kinase/D-glycero-beta-D-manno-heptose 1-phosphate adenylyltransferase HldE [Methylophaga pinxianii]